MNSLTIVRTTATLVTETTFDSVSDAVAAHQYTLRTGKDLEMIKGNKKIALKPRSIEKLIDNLNKAVFNKRAGRSAIYSLK